MYERTKIRELWQEVNPDRFVRKRQGTIREFVDRQKQVTTRNYTGVADNDDRWIAGIVEYPDSTDQKYRCVLAVLDLSSRHAWAQLLESRDQTADAFEGILEQARQEGRRLPQVLTADDTVFTSPRFQAVLRRNYIAHREQSPGAIATLNRLIGVVSRALAVKGDWAETLQHVISKHNESPCTEILGGIPDASETDTREGNDLEFNRMKREELRDARAFRVLLKAKRLNRRVHTVIWGGLRLVKGFDGSYVQDTQGRWYAMKDVLPVDMPEHEIPAAALKPGDAQAADDEIQDGTRTVGPSMDRVSPSADRARPGAAPMMPPSNPRRQPEQPEDATDVSREVDQFIARISTRQRVPQSESANAPIQTAAEANAAVERRKNLHVEKSMVRQRQPSNLKRLDRIQADLEAANAKLKAWEKQHPEWRPGG